MSKAGRILLAAALGAALLVAPVPGAAARAPKPSLTATLSALQETPENASLGTGTGQFGLSKRSGTFCWKLTFTGLTSETTAAHIHQAPVGVPGPIVIPLFAGPVTSPAQGCVKHVSKTLLGEIKQNPAAFYVNIHTLTNINGEIRGQLAPKS